MEAIHIKKERYTPAVESNKIQWKNFPPNSNEIQSDQPQKHNNIQEQKDKEHLPGRRSTQSWTMLVTKPYYQRMRTTDHKVNIEEEHIRFDAELL